MCSGVIAVVPLPARCGESNANAAVVTASARTASSATVVFKFLKSSLHVSVDEAHSRDRALRFGTMAPTRDDVERARATIGERLPRTPMLRNRTIGARLKCELFQRTGSFKSRGALNKISSLSDEEKRRGVIAISAGNHAQAAAFAAASEGIDALVVMWQGASEQKIAATRGYGAKVDLEASDPADAFDRLRELIEQTGRTLVHPFDDPLV